jgi:NTE family protein
MVLSGTAPAMTLMSGAMLAFAERDVEFEVISATGVGGLIGMLYLAPRGGDRQKALRELSNLFVSDWLYRLVPVNFKVFHKFSPLANAFYEFRKSLPKFHVEPEAPSEVKRLFNDWLELWATAMTPRGLESRHNGLMSHIPLIEDLVDFDKLKTSATRFHLNAFSLRTLKMRFFDNQTMNREAYNAAQAMFVLFPPVYTADDILTTGATRDPTGLQAVWLFERDKLDRVVALDPISRSYWREPANAYDAFQLMLVNPIAALQELTFKWYVETRQAGATLPKLHILPVQVDASYYPKMLEWTHANAVTLRQIGYEAAVRFARALAVNHPDLDTLESPQYDFAGFLETQPRPQQFREMFKRAYEGDNWGRIVAHLRKRHGEIPPDQEPAPDKDTPPPPATLAAGQIAPGSAPSRGKAVPSRGRALRGKRVSRRQARSGRPRTRRGKGASS